MLRRFLHSDAFRAPQFAAAALLLVYLLQCVWLVRVQTLHAPVRTPTQALRIYQGLEQWKGGAIAGTPESLRSEAATGVPSAGRAGHLRVRDGYDQDRSPLYYLVAAAPLLLRPGSWLPESLQPLLAATPYLFFGVMLGASLWYVARRLYGNAGGYIALALYCFSPAMIVNVAGAQSLGEMGGVWGAFGTVFTAIAVAHTLYAPREVVLWNWRRILLLGLSLALAAGNQFSLAVLALVILPLMFWVAPVRPRAVLVIWTAAIAVAVVLLFAAYLFRACVVLARDAARALDQLRARRVWHVCLLPQCCANDLRQQPAADARLARGADRVLRMEARTLFRQHRAAPDRGTGTHFGPGRAQFSGTRIPSDHARVPLRLRQRSVRRSAGDSAKPARGGWPVRIVERLRHLEPVAVVAHLSLPRLEDAQPRLT